MLVMALILTLSAAAISIGVVYNNARIALSLRSRDLATLRVLGFTRRRDLERCCSASSAMQVLAGSRSGLWLGTLWSRVLARSIDPETIRFAVHISRPHVCRRRGHRAGVGAHQRAARAPQARRLDLVGVLKSSE